MKVNSKRGTVIVDDVFRTTPDYLLCQICKDFSHDHGVEITYNQTWHIKEKAKERIYGAPRVTACAPVPDLEAEPNPGRGHFFESNYFFFCQ